jgi:translation initiation factor 1 (eIF-1/SUI1)
MSQSPQIFFTVFVFWLQIMPQKRKPTKQDYMSEGRPAGPTLGSFIAAKLEASTPSSSDAVIPDEPEPVPSRIDVSKSLTPSVSTSDRYHTPKPSELVEDSAQIFQIRRTKKGNLPVSYENRNKGKKVTVIANVTGDAKMLLSELKHRAGCGGVIKGETIELQGDRRDLVTKFLKGHPCLR